LRVSAKILSPYRDFSPASAVPTQHPLCENINIIAKSPRGNQARRNAITVRTKLRRLKRRQDGISTEALGRAAQAGASVVLPQSVAKSAVLSQLVTDCAEVEGVFWRNATRRQKRRKRPDFDAPPFCREARRHWQNVKGRKIDVATGFFAGALPRIRGKASEP